MFDVNLNWKEFNVNLVKVKEWLDANVESSITGLSGNSVLQIHFLSEPSEAELSAINAYWDGLTEESEEVTSYLPGEQVSQNEQSQILALKESAKTKLLGLGLSEAEVLAMLGV